MDMGSTCHPALSALLIESHDWSLVQWTCNLQSLLPSRASLICSAFTIDYLQIACPQAGKSEKTPSPTAEGLRKKKAPESRTVNAAFWRGRFLRNTSKNTVFSVLPPGHRKIMSLRKIRRNYCILLYFQFRAATSNS